MFISIVRCIVYIMYLCILACVVSCSSEVYTYSEFEAGESFTDSRIRVLQIDTLTVRTSTMKFDSLATSEAIRMLVGKYTDPVFGSVTATSFAQVIPSTYTIDVEAEYDSIVLYLKMDSYYYNDTLQTNTIHVREVSENLKPTNGDYFYNTSKVGFGSEDIGSLTYRPRPFAKDSLAIKLSDSIGIALFESLQDKKVVNLDEFKNLFKGIALIPGEADNGSIIGFSKASQATYIRLYHSISESDERVQSSLDLQINTGETPIPFFNGIHTVNPIEPLQTLNSREDNLFSADAGNLAFIQSGVGIAMKLQFPHLKSLYDINGSGTILDAVLKIKPAASSYDQSLKLRDSLSIYVVDKNNALTEQLNVDGIASIIAVLNTDDQEFNNIYYEVYLGTYLDKLLTTSVDADEGLILFPEDYSSAVDRFILQGNSINTYETILELTYAIYNEN